jgi:hypothetical protein
VLSRLPFSVRIPSPVRSVAACDASLPTTLISPHFHRRRCREGAPDCEPALPYAHGSRLAEAQGKLPLLNRRGRIPKPSPRSPAVTTPVVCLAGPSPECVEIWSQFALALTHPTLAVCVPCPAHGGFCLTLRWVLRFAYGYLKGGSDAGISHVEQASPPLPSGSDCCCIQRVRRPAARRALRGRGCRHCCAALLCGGLHADIVADGGASLNSAHPLTGPKCRSL